MGEVVNDLRGDMRADMTLIRQEMKQQETSIKMEIELNKQAQDVHAEVVDAKLGIFMEQVEIKIQAAADSFSLQQQQMDALKSGLEFSNNQGATMTEGDWMQDEEFQERDGTAGAMQAMET